MKSRLLFFVALFALVAVVAFGAGSSHLVHGSSPVFASDPVFSGTGVQLPSDSTNPSHLAGNIYFNSATGYLTFDDGTTYHSIPGLDMANTWTGVQTFNANPVLASGVGITWGGTTGNIGSATAYPATIFANALTAEGTTPTINGFSLGTSTAGTGILGASNVFTAAQTFNGGIAFNAAGSIASTSTYIEADGAGGNLILNAPTSRGIHILIGGTETAEFDVNALLPPTDSTFKIGSSGLRLLSISSIAYNVYHASGDAYPSFQASSGEIAFGAGGSTPLSTTLTWVSGGLQFNQIFKAYNNINTVGLGIPPIYGSGLLVSIGTTSTTIASYTPTSATGQQFVIQWTLSASAATTPTCTATFTDPKAGAQTVTLFNSAMSADTVTQGTYSLVATSGSAVTMSCSALIGGDIFGTASISQYQ